MTGSTPEVETQTEFHGPGFDAGTIQAVVGIVVGSESVGKSNQVSPCFLCVHLSKQNKQNIIHSLI